MSHLRIQKSINFKRNQIRCFRVDVYEFFRHFDKQFSTPSHDWRRKLFEENIAKYVFEVKRPFDLDEYYLELFGNDNYQEIL